MGAWRRGQALSQDLRERVLAAQGAAAAVAARFGVSATYVLKARHRAAQGLMQPGAQCNHVLRKLDAVLDARIAEQVAAAPDQTIDELCEWLAAAYGVRVSHATMYKSLARQGLTRKK